MGCHQEVRQPVNVVLITVDTLRADRVGRGLTPAIDALARDGTTFTNTRATVPLTLPSHVTIMSGMLPPEHGARQNGDLGPTKDAPLLARLFRDHGYQTAAFVGAYVLDRRFGLADGFDHYDDRIPRAPNAPARLEAERRADEVVTAANAWIDRADTARPLFVWVHLYDPHAPYTPPADFLQRANGHAYDGEVAFADAQLALLLDRLRAKRGANLLIAVAGDHGEGLGEHGESTHGMLAYDSTLRVPLIFHGPGFEHGRRISTPASLRDLAPTLLARAGLNPPAQMTGVNLLAPGAPSPIYAETTYPTSAGWSPLRVLADERWKLVASSGRELYDVTRDPAEQHDLAAANPSVVTAMAARADQIFGAARTAASAAVSGDAAERLRALGYVAPVPAPAGPTAGANPRDHIAAWNRFEGALTMMAAGNSAGALADLRALASAHPDARVFQSSYAQALKDTGRAREAFALYRRLVTRWPNDATLFHDLAVAARDAGDVREALRAEQAALALNANDANAHNGLGLLHADAGRDRDAAASFERATTLDPNNASFWTNLGNARRALGDLAGAERAYMRSLDLNPRYADAANGLGVIFVQQRRLPDAIRYLERAVAADPDFYEAQLNLGIALQEGGDRVRAAEQYRKVIGAAPAGSHEKRAASELLAALR